MAETLIVMGVIGIVSALTLPNLNSSTGEKEKIAKVKKLYQNLDDAVGRAVAIYGPIQTWVANESTDTARTTKVADRISEFLKVSKTCGTAANSSCFADVKLRDYSTKAFSGADTSFYKFVIADGASVAIRYTYDRDINDYYVDMYVDIDGKNKGKSTLGEDIFLYKAFLDKNEVFPHGYDMTISKLIENNKQGAKNGYSAAGWVINYENMDYLKLTSSGKCPSGVIPTDSNPRCK